MSEFFPYLRYDVVKDIMNRIHENKAAYIDLYLLNPHISFKDVYHTFLIFIGIITLRLVLSGVHHKKFQKFTPIFRVAFKNIYKPKYHSKFCENLWYSCWHTVSFCFGLYTLSQLCLSPESPGWPRLLLKNLDTKWYWFPTVAEYESGSSGWPFFVITPLTRVYYLTELAFWLSCVVYLIFETIRDDFYALLVHHIVTCTLIGFSYTLSFWKIGMVIIMVHDIADIILYIAKTIYYTKLPRIIVDVLFILLSICFFISRLLVFPLLCLKPAVDITKIYHWTNGIISSSWEVPGGVVLPFFLIVLQILHIFWFGLIVKMILRAYSGSRVSKKGDIRSDTESDVIKDKLSSDEDANSTDDGYETDARMKLSSLPGVRPTLSKKELKDPKLHHIKQSTKKKR